ncbi:EAL domain-containing response regulator [Steroidobacter sp. S1-65]|uniref:EAL domain-containing response regulator n=1 Tax=Steroidobacter gossypii TaxID=2805490 RepID=A0ABS1WVD6_9GAMM|nr:EAL domain-containing response regulator [Steroidobacter gossypii]MBM0104941.1 EAL domain-containing response regulator [Steroidobacter gossypii]
MFSEDHCNRRILLVDDNPAIHENFRRILGRVDDATSALNEHENALFGEARVSAVRPEFQLDSAFQGEEAVELVRRSVESGARYALAFVDTRMPPGIDGVETIARIWKLDPQVQVVICTAFSDYSWHDLNGRLRRSDQLLILKKPFDSIEVMQLAASLSQKWHVAREEQRRIDALERRIAERGKELQALQLRNAEVDEASGHIRNTAGSAVTHEQKSKRWNVLKQAALRGALQAGQIGVHYQPVVAVKGHRIVSLEALARWHHPQLGEIPPGEFIPVAERTGLIVPLGQFVLRSACEQVMRWEQEGVPTVGVAVNVSPAQLEVENFAEQVRRILRDTGMPPHKLALELTESTFIANLPRHTQTLEQLRAAGVRVQIDDFGTGYSSLAYLRRLPIDAIKIDRSFVRQLGVDATDEAIVAAIMAMARSLRLTVIAEGVETALQLDALARHDCEAAQGFYFSRPLEPERCRQLLLDMSERPSFTDTLRIQLADVARAG